MHSNYQHKATHYGDLALVNVHDRINDLCARAGRLAYQVAKSAADSGCTDQRPFDDKPRSQRAWDMLAEAQSWNAVSDDAEALAAAEAAERGGQDYVLTWSYPDSLCGRCYQVELTGAESAAKTVPLSCVHSCTLQHYAGSGLRHTHGNGRPRSVKCTYCGGQLLTESGYWTVQAWTGDGRYSLASALKICRSESAADTWALDHRLGGNGEMCVRFIRADQPLALSGADCTACASRTVHRLDECSRYALPGRPVPGSNAAVREHDAARHALREAQPAITGQTQPSAASDPAEPENGSQSRADASYRAVTADAMFDLLTGQAGIAEAEARDMLTMARRYGWWESEGWLVSFGGYLDGYSAVMALAECGCPKAHIRDCGHQEGCESS